MSIAMELSWIKGRRIALCEPDEERFVRIKNILIEYGLEVFAFNTPDAVIKEIENRRYSTHRFFLAILIDFHLAEDVEKEWVEVTSGNPTILETPVVLMRADSELNQAMPLISKGYFRFQLPQPVTEVALTGLLLILNRWKRQQHELAQSAQPAAKLGRDR